MYTQLEADMEKWGALGIRLYLKTNSEKWLVGLQLNKSICISH